MRGSTGRAVALALSGLLFLAGCIETPSKIDDGSGGDAPIWMLPELPHIDVQEFLTNHAKFVSSFPHRAANSVTHLGAREALAKEFKAVGLEVWRQTFTNGTAQENICGVKIGAVDPDTWVVVGGHYDTTTWDAIPLGIAGGRQGEAPGRLVSQGAYDDGSGTWITVELAKAFAQVDTYYSILFCAFDGEERGTQGSREVYLAMRDSAEFPWPIDETRAMLDLDMFGICWPVRAPIYYSQNHDELFAKVDEARKALGVPDDLFIEWESGVARSGRGLGSSDYGWWRGGGVPTIFFISDFMDVGVPTPMPIDAMPAVPGSYPFWHWMDTVDTMTLMAGGEEMLAAGFETALHLSVETLSVMALHPEIELEADA